LPAYNEAHRLPPYLAEVRHYLEATMGTDYEVLVVDDGSTDRLVEALAPLRAHWPRCRMLSHPINQGKGAAVRTGALAAQGTRLLFADADGAAPIEELKRLAAALDAGADVAIGSRLLPAAGIERHRAFMRGWTGWLFAAVARYWLGLKVRDTQCGFKMFQGESGRKLFKDCTEMRYLFDLDLLLLAQRAGLRVVEVPIAWHEVAGGHLRPLREIPRIVAGLWRLRRRKNR
jgi:dolichyl-phosphate beta-glucosyltransferase